MLVMAVGARLITAPLLRHQHSLLAESSGDRDFRHPGPECGHRAAPAGAIPRFYRHGLLFIAFANLARFCPAEPPTGSLSTTAALAICVFVAVPFYGIAESGLIGYLKTYLEPTWLMLRFTSSAK